MLTESNVLDALRSCFDPAIPCNIVDLGLVRSLDIAPDPGAPGSGIPGVPRKHRIHIELTLTNPSIPDGGVPQCSNLDVGDPEIPGDASSPSGAGAEPSLDGGAG